MKNSVIVLFLALVVLTAGLAQTQSTTDNSGHTSVPKTAATVKLASLVNFYYKTKVFAAEEQKKMVGFQKQIVAALQSPQAMEGPALDVQAKVTADIRKKMGETFQADGEHNRKEIAGDLGKVIHDYAAAHGIDVVVEASGNNELSAEGLGNVLPGTVDLKKIPDITDEIINQLYANDPAKYTSKPPAPVEQPAPASVATVDVDRVAASSNKIKAAQTRLALQQGRMEIQRVINDYATAGKIYILDTSPVTDVNGYPKIASGSPNLKGIPDVTNDIIARVNAVGK